MPSILSALSKIVDCFQGGRLKYFLEEWRNITSDNYILETVSGIGLDTTETEFENLKKHVQVGDKDGLIDKEIKKLFKKGIIETTVHEEEEFISPVF